MYEAAWILQFMLPLHILGGTASVHEFHHKIIENSSNKEKIYDGFAPRPNRLRRQNQSPKDEINDSRSSMTEAPDHLSEWCPPGYRSVGGQCFHVSKQLSTWVEAVTTCDVRGAVLAQVKDPKTFRTYMKENFNGKVFWLGASDMVHEGWWVWVLGGLVSPRFSWPEGEPSGGTNENCLSIGHNNDYDDEPCDTLHYYICEANTVKAPGKLSSNDTITYTGQQGRPTVQSGDNIGSKLEENKGWSEENHGLGNVKQIPHSSNRKGQYGGYGESEGEPEGEPEGKPEGEHEYDYPSGHIFPFAFNQVMPNPPWIPPFPNLFPQMQMFSPFYYHMMGHPEPEFEPEYEPESEPEYGYKSEPESEPEKDSSSEERDIENRKGSSNFNGEQTFPKWESETSENSLINEHFKASKSQNDFTIDQHKSGESSDNQKHRSKVYSEEESQLSLWKEGNGSPVLSDEKKWDHPPSMQGEWEMCDPSCANGGTCEDRSCICTDGWTGPTCEDSKCHFQCEHGGICTAPYTCTCTPGWEGVTCGNPTCQNGCENGGSCEAPNSCKCIEGWTGSNCSVAVCEHNCENGGTCESPNRCHCMEGWTGTTCKTSICKGGCENGGTCEAPNICSCTLEWEGPTCSNAVCEDRCRNDGECIAPNSCSCTKGWTGNNCAILSCEPNCMNGGICEPSHSCACTEGWTGPTCEIPVCDPACGHGGYCSGPNTCLCRDGWSGPVCKTRSTEMYTKGNTKGFIEGVISNKCTGPFMRVGMQCLFVSTDEATWRDALEECIILDGRLVVLTDPDPLVDFIKENYGIHEFWLGATDMKGSWRWISGKKVAPGFPWRQRHSGSREKHENCLAIGCLGGPNTQYHEDSCYRRYRYICEAEYESTEKSTKFYKEK